MVCAKCNKDFPNPGDRAKCAECAKEFHSACCRLRTIKKLQGIKVSTWRCDSCNVDTPSPVVDEDSPLLQDILISIQKEMSQLRVENRNNFDSIQSSIVTMQGSLIDISSKLAVVETENAKLKEECSQLKKNNSKLAERVTELENDVHDFQQYSRIDNVEIRGIPMTNGEDVYAVLKCLAGAIGVSYNSQDISVAHRLGRKPVIIVRFVSRSARSTWLTAAKRKRVNTTDLLPSMVPAPVFIQEHLTPHNKYILGRARDLVRRKQLAYAWVKDGKVLVRRKDGDPAIRLRNVDDAYEASPGLPQAEEGPHDRRRH